MKITIESTDVMTRLDGVPVRLWESVTEQGVRCKVFVHRIAVHNEADATQFDPGAPDSRSSSEEYIW
jgi:hypothetical protein